MPHPQLLPISSSNHVQPRGHHPPPPPTNPPLTPLQHFISFLQYLPCFSTYLLPLTPVHQDNATLQLKTIRHIDYFINLYKYDISNHTFQGNVLSYVVSCLSLLIFQNREIIYLHVKYATFVIPWLFRDNFNGIITTSVAPPMVYNTQSLKALTLTNVYQVVHNKFFTR